MKKLGVYIHIPFCLSKCKYCGFYSRSGVNIDEQEEYIKGLIEDIKEYGNEYGKKYVVDTVFIGGGTPSILEPSLIGDVLCTLDQCFKFEQNAEITIEANPKTLTKEKLIAYRQYGINRLSIGLQSFDDGILEILGRAHRGEDFVNNFNLARKCGFDNINVDLMFGLPDHTMEVWKDTLNRLIAMEPEHVSFYTLQIEEGTPFYEMYRREEINLVSEEVDRKMYHWAIDNLAKAGFEHYEISNAAKPGFHCRHNLKYWNMEDYLGIGDNASSFMEGVRFKEGPEPEYHENSLGDCISEFVFTGLRKREGISLAEFQEKYGQEFWQYFENIKEEVECYFEEGLLIEANGQIFLSREGIDHSNNIMADFV